MHLENTFHLAKRCHVDMFSPKTEADKQPDEPRVWLLCVPREGRSP